MSLKNRYNQIFEKEKATHHGSLTVYQTFLRKEIEDLPQIDLSYQINNSESQVSSQFTDESKTSIEIDGLRFSQEIEKILAKHLKQASVVEKNVTNNYEGMLKSLRIGSLGKISEVSYEDSWQKENNEGKLEAESKAYDLDSPSVLIENTNKVNQDVRVVQKTGKIQTSLRNSTFALTNRIFCMKCSVEVYTNVTYQMKKMNLWGSIGFFFDAIKCCGEPRMMSRYQELVHKCQNCGSIVARISTN